MDWWYCREHGEHTYIESLYETGRLDKSKNLFNPNLNLAGDKLVKRLISAHHFREAREEDVRETVGQFWERFGPLAVGNAIEWLDRLDELLLQETICIMTPYYCAQQELICLLADFGDERAVDPILRHFIRRQRLFNWPGLIDLAAPLFARIGPNKFAPALLACLDHKDDLVRNRAAFHLGTLALDETRGALRSALERYGQWVKDGLTEANTEFARSLVTEWDAKRRAAGPLLETITDNMMVEILRNLCRAYMANNKEDVRRLEPMAKDIGEELNRRGGIEEMRRVFTLLGDIPGSRTLELHWHGIGRWRG